MRTTITLDPDVANQIKEQTRELQITPKEAINKLIRLGFLGLQKQAQDQPRKKLKIKSFPLGFPQELQNANFNHVAFMSDEEVEQEFFNKHK